MLLECGEADRRSTVEPTEPNRTENDPRGLPCRRRSSAASWPAGQPDDTFKGHSTRVRSSEKKNSTARRPSVASIGVSLEAPSSRPLPPGTLVLPDQTTTNPPTWTSIQTRAARGRRHHRHRRNPPRLPPRPPCPLRPLRPPRRLRRLEPRLKSPSRRQAPRRRRNRGNRAPRRRPRHPQHPALPASGGLSDLHIAMLNAIWWPKFADTISLSRQRAPRACEVC